MSETALKTAEKRQRTLERRVERLRTQKKEQDAELSELKWHLSWVIDFLTRPNLTDADRVRIALEHAYNAREVGRP